MSVCSECGKTGTVHDVRNTKTATRRRYKCPSCSHRWTTYERCEAAGTGEPNTTPGRWVTIGNVSMFVPLAAASEIDRMRENVKARV